MTVPTPVAPGAAAVSDVPAVAEGKAAAAGTTPRGLVLDLFAGPGGWDHGALPLGLRPVGVEWDEAACLTARAAGHARVRADVAALPTEPMVGKVTGLIASPPCQDFSLAGKQAGIEGDKGQLIAQVLRWTDALRPRWVACEQVPPCIDIWREYAAVMRGWGYRTWTGILNAADYGVPQTRKRAFLLASLDRQPARPEPTHARGGDVDLFGERLPWISMAEALGWFGPSFVRRERSGDRSEEGFDGASVPAQCLTSKTRNWLRMGNQEKSAVRHIGQPAPTVLFGARSNKVEWYYERPATTVVGSYCPDVISPPGYRTTVSRQNAEGGVRVTVAEGGVLQSFPADYPWQGSRTKQFQQVGNAVPPLLATHVLAAVTGIAVPARREAAA